MVEIRRTQKQFGCFIVVCFFISFTSLLIGFRPRINGVGIGFSTDQWRWSFPVRMTRRKVAIEQNWSVVRPVVSYDSLPWVIVSFFVSLSISSVIYWLWQPRRSAPKEGDNVTATRDPGRGKRHGSDVATAPQRSISNILPLYSTYILTHSPVQLYYHTIHLRPSVGVSAFTVEKWTLRNKLSESDFLPSAQALPLRMSNGDQNVPQPRASGDKNIPQHQQANFEVVKGS